ncbi:MAG: glutamate-1-semialdehyde 2,1-aminomutase [Deltaproteobacteria bacterium]|nr:glutamate-1-semialdehyde 2,1-aminomutase [Deltaproteobacteria bacterium]
MNISTSQKWFDQAAAIIPGGVNSPVRACKSVDSTPLFISSAKGATLTDADGNTYLDYVASWGPMILGHAHPEVIAAVKKAADLGTSYGAPCRAEIELAELIVDCVPGIEMVRMVNSGTEATMSAVRLARAITGRDKIIKFDGCYHGHADSFLVAAGSGVATLGIPGSPGVPDSFVQHTLSLPFNNLESVSSAMDTLPGQVAAIIVEPIAGNMGVVLPQDGFLTGLRNLCTKHGTLLVFDEVITGFRVALGGAQQLYGVTPDLTCLGKIIGGGLPVGAYGGSKAIMSAVAPEGNVYQAGTLSGNPVAMAAGAATLQLLKKNNVYLELEQKGRQLFTGLRMAAENEGITVTVNFIASMGSMFFHPGPVTDFTSVKQSNSSAFINFYKYMRESGIYLAPSAFEAAFVSAAHTSADLDKTITAASTAFKRLTSSGEMG